MKKKQFQQILTFTAAALTLLTLSAADPTGGLIPESGGSRTEQRPEEPDHEDQDNDEPGISLLSDQPPITNVYK